MFRYVIGIEKQINKKDITSNSGNLYSLFYLIRNTLKKSKFLGTETTKWMATKFCR